ncbi:serine hydrolase [Streptomyces sp. GC420]|uniref:serine hydrolase domain-containing protein n=1 Tax=Streptomyces sp. GC420 TaxID=2697568 RepID=UPI0014152866|nr:serine hydrolase domain-containing protein [Streptomyces sp. GC420]NBM15303.1 serine hydrolase [Streptomyces sp. GC420]
MTTTVRPRKPARARAALVTALVVGLAAGGVSPALASPALAASRATAPVCDLRGGPDAAKRSAEKPDAKALCAAVAGLPRADATAALVRVGGTDGRWRGVSGVADLRTGRAAMEHARFRAGSVTKVFTAAVVLQMASEGRIDLDRPVRHYLPEHIPAAYRGVTVRHLLNHTSGIQAPDMPGDTFEEWYAHRFDVHTPQEMVASATAKEREFVPGAMQHYLNINYTVLGLLIEEVSGHAYAEEVGRRVIRPLGLRDTCFPGADPRIHGPHHRGYQAVRRADGTTELRDVTVWGPTSAWAAGDIISSTADLERFTTALFGGRVVPGPELEEMFTLPAPSVREFGSGDEAVHSAGMSVVRLGGVEVWGKSGGRWGYSTAMGATRDLSRTLVYSINTTDAKGQGINPTAGAVFRAAFAR